MEMQRIDPKVPGEVQRWAELLGVTPKRLQEAIVAIGTDVDKIKGYLAVHPHHSHPQRK